MSEFQKPYNKVGYLNAQIIFDKKLSVRAKNKLKRKVNKIIGRKLYKDV